MSTREEIDAEMRNLLRKQEALRAEYDTIRNGISTISSMASVTTLSSDTSQPPAYSSGINYDLDQKSPSFVSTNPFTTPISSVDLPPSSIRSSASSFTIASSIKNDELRKNWDLAMNNEKKLMQNPPRTQSLDLIFLVDCTGSMSTVIHAVAQKLITILDFVTTTFFNVEVQVAFVGYRDVGYGSHIIYGFQDPVSIRSKIAEIAVITNCDEAEDVLGGYNEVLELLKGRSRKRHRCLLHFLDAPPHGKRFHGVEKDSYDRFWNIQPPQPTKPSHWLTECVQTLCSQKVYCNMIQILKGRNQDILRKTVNEFQTEFEQVRGQHGTNKFATTTVAFSGGRNQADMEADVQNFVSKVLKAVVDSLDSSGMTRSINSGQITL